MPSFSSSHGDRAGTRIDPLLVGVGFLPGRGEILAWGGGEGNHHDPWSSSFIPWQQGGAALPRAVATRPAGPRGGEERKRQTPPASSSISRTRRVRSCIVGPPRG